MKTNSHKPDLILLARTCHTLDRRGRKAQAVAIADGRILALGSRRSIFGFRSRGTRVLDLRSATLTPGLVDCHTHLFYWALHRALTIDVSQARSLAAVLDTIRKQSRVRRVGSWILAQGFDHNRWGHDFPHAADLDRIEPTHPVMVRSRDGHTLWLNTPALKRVGITRSTADPTGGRFLRDARGEPTGIIQEAQEAAVVGLPNPLYDFARRTDAAAQRTIDRALDAVYRIERSLGFVGVHTMDDGASLAHLLRHRHEGRLGLRVVHAVPLADLRSACDLGLRSGFGDEWLRIGGVKIFADGALGSQTAYMFAPYPGRGDYCGVPVVAGDELRERVCTAVQHGWVAWIHAIGDRAVHEAAAALAASRATGPGRMPHRIEHVQCARLPDIRRLARAGIVASVQPCHLLGDIPTADRHWPRARRNAYPFRSMIDAGVTLAAGSDVPIESSDPRRSLFAATRRTDERGQPAEGWFPQQRITTEEVLRAFTVGAAAAAGRLPPAGTLAPGAPADITIWAEDPLDVDPEALLDIGIIGCVVAGQIHQGQK